MTDGKEHSRERDNLFKPIDLEGRLSGQPRSRTARHRLMMQPGQLYGGARDSALWEPTGELGLNGQASPAEAEADTASYPATYSASYPAATGRVPVQPSSFPPFESDVPSYLKRQAYSAEAEAETASFPASYSASYPAATGRAPVQPSPFPPFESDVPSYLKRQAPPAEAEADTASYPAVTGRAPVANNIPPYLKKQPLRPFTPYPPTFPSGGETDDSAVPGEAGVHIASTFPPWDGMDAPSVAPVRDEIAAFFDSPENPSLPEMSEEDEYYPAPAFLPSEGSVPAEDSAYEDAILPESAELPQEARENPDYQPPAYEFFSTAPGAGELGVSGFPWPENAAPVPAYTPPSPEASGLPPEGAPALESPRIRQTFKQSAPDVPASPPPQKRSKADGRREAAAKPPIRWARLAAIVACAGMLIFCGVVGGQLLLRIEENGKEMERLMDAYEQSGGSLIQSASRVDLPPAGQTLEPSTTNPPFVSVDPGTGQAQADPDLSEALSPSETQAPSAQEGRTRQTRYPDNSLRNVIDAMQAVHKEYPDVVGRLSIPGVLDEMVVFRDNTYYLSRNYRGTNASGGAVFMDEHCSLLNPPENLLLRGQGDVPGKSFAPLWQYRDGGESFVRSAYTATLTTLYEEESYVLLAVIVADGDPAKSGYFNFSGHAAFATDAQMAAYVSEAMGRSLYRFSTDVQPSDRLLTLATVSAGENEQCIVLIFRMKREGEKK